MKKNTYITPNIKVRKITYTPLLTDSLTKGEDDNNPTNAESKGYFHSSFTDTYDE